MFASPPYMYKWASSAYHDLTQVIPDPNPQNMADTQTTNGSSRIERVHYNPNATATAASHDADANNTKAQVTACSRSHGPEFKITFDTNTPITCASDLFMASDFPATTINYYAIAECPSDPYTRIIGWAEIAVYVPGYLENSYGSRAMGDVEVSQEKCLFQFDLTVQVVDGAARSMLGVCVGERDTREFDLVVGRARLC